ncbi:MAG: riboflavin synthase [Pseudomonadota bacterium]
MFTGIITDVGKVESIQTLDQGKRIRVRTAHDTTLIDIGASVCHNGVCLTVVEKNDGWIEVEAWEEALRLSSLGEVSEGDPINLELSLKIGDELGGHLVSGHVDGIATITEVESEGEAVRFTLEAPDHLAKFIASKGSVALDGTSLTVNEVSDNRFDVLLIRHSLEVTTWGNRKKGDRINLEVDQMARYAARLAEYGG